MNMSRRNKRALIGDIHLGCHSNSENWHKTSLDFAMFLKERLIESNVEDIEFFGDFFDNRNEIGVQTLHVASQFLDILSDFNITIIAGNHDMYFKNRNDVHSIGIFSGRKNITIIDNSKYETVSNSKILHLPWGASIDNIEPVDMIFGHLELNGFYMIAGKPADGKVDPNLLLKNCDLIFSGHFHLRDERKYSNGKSVIYIGTPYQLNWGEMSNVPGFYIMDFESKKYEFIENTISPRHVKISSSEASSMPESAIKNNIISMEFSTETPEEQMKLRNEIFKFNPAEIRFTVQDQQSNILTEEVQYDANIDLLNMMWDFTDKLDVGDTTDMVKEKLKELYNKHAK
jgi:DNA repair exonuclease SbcCD nuclease subunit